jgi:hypothetical protein
MDMQHVNAKVFVESSEASLEPLVPIFHRWIQEKVLDELLLDVADYRHVYAGPGVILIGHEANYSLDNTGNRLGVLYNRKTPLEGSNQQRLAQATRAALNVCKRLESESRMAGGIRFNRQQIQLAINDRLLAPNTPETRAAADPELRDFCSRLFAGAAYSLRYEEDPRQRFGIQINASQPVSADTLLANLNSIS